MIDWKYCATPLREGTAIIAEFTTCLSDKVRIAKLTRVYANQEFYAWEVHDTKALYRDEQIYIKAWDYYNGPTPPEKPHNCPDPECGCKMELLDNLDELGFKHYYFRCPACQWDSFTRPTKEDAIKALNSIKVEK